MVVVRNRILVVRECVMAGYGGDEIRCEISPQEQSDEGLVGQI